MSHIGGRVLRALAIYKYMDVYALPGAKNDAIVAAALAESKTYADDRQGLATESNCYDMSVVMIFLLEADSSKYRPQIQNLLDELMRRQSEEGRSTAFTSAITLSSVQLSAAGPLKVGFA